MDCFDSLIDRVPPLPPQATGAEAYARFQNEPETLVIAVVDAAGRPLGLLERDGFRQRMAGEYGRALYGGRPVSSLMHPDPLTVDAATPVEVFRREALASRGPDLLRGFVVTRAGCFHGVGTALSLLRAAEAAGQGRAEEAARTAEQLARAQAEARCATRAKAQFLGVMSHEIRTPLNGVLAVAQLLQRQPLPGDGPAYVRTIVESSETLMRLLSNAIDLSRAETDGLELAPEPTRLRDLMDEVQAVWITRAGVDGVSLGVTYHGEPELAAELDPVRLKQVFDNLVGNALKATRRGGVEAGLEAVREGGRIRLRGHVLDTGPTADPSALSELFDPLAASERDGSGHGARLGLAICRGVLEAMGGCIWAENNPGAGLVFRFEFEARACEAAEQAGAAPEPEAPPPVCRATS